MADRAVTRDAALMTRVAEILDRTLRPWHRFTLTGLEHLPPGPALLVGNHSGSMMPVDGVLVPLAIYRARGLADVPWGLGHALLFQVPAIARVFNRLGVLPANHENAARVFAQGGKVFVYPGGEVDATRPWTRRNEVLFDGRSGFVRLALRERVPIVPVATAGAHSTLMVLSQLRGLATLLGMPRWARLGVLPLALSIPWGLSIGPMLPHLPPPVRVSSAILPPIALPPDHPDDAEAVAETAERVRRQLEDAVRALARRKP